MLFFGDTQVSLVSGTYQRMGKHLKSVAENSCKILRMTYKKREADFILRKKGSPPYYYNDESMVLNLR